MQQRITHKQVEQACERYNRALKLTFRNVPRTGYLRWQDIRGDGRNRRGLYANITDGHASGVGASPLRQRTMRETIAAIDLAIQADKSPSFAVIIRAIHERGLRQRIALLELARRGLWLAPEQRKQAGLLP